MNRTVKTDDLVLLTTKTEALWKAVESALRISVDLDENKANIGIADENIDRDQKQLRKGKLTKKQRSKVERTIEYHQELMSCTAKECEPQILEFSEAMAKVEAALTDLAEIYDWLASVPRFEHADGSPSLKKKHHNRTAA